MSPPISRAENLRRNITAGFVVFLVALPLNLGIALASNAPLMSGMLAGLVGGVVVSLLSASQLSITGPAAGLAAVVVATQNSLGSFDALLLATVVAGCFQILFGLSRAGFAASLIPASVIHGMVFGIGLIIVFQQVPHALGLKATLHFEESIFEIFSANYWHDAIAMAKSAWSSPNEASVVLFLSSLALMLWWEKMARRSFVFFTVLPSALAAVTLGSSLNYLFGLLGPDHILGEDSGRLVDLPLFHGLDQFFATIPSISMESFAHSEIWKAGFMLAVVASIQSLLSVEASEKLDPQRRIPPANRELVAQGVGNIISGLLGGLPMTAVIVRTSTNIFAGASSRLSGFSQGILLVLAVTILPRVINLIPLASLGAVLLMIGLRLCNPRMVREAWQHGADQLIPFVATAVCVVTINLFWGVIVGTVIGLLIVLRLNFHSAFTLIQDGDDFFVRFAKDVTFVQKFVLRKMLADIPNHSRVFIDGGGAMFVDFDIRDVIEDFKRSAEERNISVSVRNIYAYKSPLLV